MYVSELSSTMLTILLNLRNGSVAESYTITYSNIDDTQCFNDSYNITGVDSSSSMFVLKDLEEYTTYSISVTVLLSDGETGEDSLTVTTADAGEYLLWLQS